MRERFEELLLSIQREGIDKLLDFIRKSDFYTAPASTRYHGAHEGGLLKHSLNAYDCLERKTSGSEHNIWKPFLVDTDEHTIIIVSLLHDLCKTYYYTTDTRNVKENGVWVQKPYYTVDDKYPYGHGEKSVMMIEQFIKLSMAERMAIRWHMGAYEGEKAWNTLGTAMDKYPLVLALHQADMEATYLLEKDGGS